MVFQWKTHGFRWFFSGKPKFFAGFSCKKRWVLQVLAAFQVQRGLVNPSPGEVVQAFGGFSFDQTTKKQVFKRQKPALKIF